MDMQKLKRMLWMMNELINPSPNGNTQQELSDKWAISSKNDYKEPGLTPSTFHRIKNALKELFECEIIVNHTTNQYSVEIPDDSVPDEQLTLLDMLLVKHRQPEKSNSINDILQMLTMGNDIPADDMRAARDLSLLLKRLPFKYAGRLLDIAKDKGVDEADRAEWDEHYPNYICLWDESVYSQTWQWLSIGFYDSEVWFYVVTNEEDAAQRQRKAIEMGLDEGVRYRGGYYWHEPADKNLFVMEFETEPDMLEVVKRAEYLLQRLKEVNP